MKIRVIESDTIIGEAEVFALDPPMRVAMAMFRAAPAYDAARHANVVDGDYTADRCVSLRLELATGLPLRCEEISIHDYPTLGERQLHILGVLEPSFEDLFADHADYKAYWNEA